VKTTSSAPATGTGEKGKRMKGMEKDLSSYPTVKRQLQLFIFFGHFAESSCSELVLLESHSPKPSCIARDPLTSS